MVLVSDLKLSLTTLGERLTDEELDELVREVDQDGEGQVNFDGQYSVTHAFHASEICVKILLALPFLYHFRNDSSSAHKVIHLERSFREALPVDVQCDAYLTMRNSLSVLLYC